MIESKNQLTECPFNDHGYIWSLGEFLYLTRYLRLENVSKKDGFNTPEWMRIGIFHCILKIVRLLNNCIFPGYTYLSEFTKSKLVTNLNNRSFYLGLGLAAFIIASILCFVCGWIPFVERKKKDLIRVRSFIALIPLELIIKMKGFRNFFSKIVLTNVI